MNPAWCGRYVGIPYLDKGRDRDGCDCWGLVRMVYAERYNIEMPSMADSYESAERMASTSAALASNGYGYADAGAPWEPADKPKEGDVIVLRVAGAPCHVGVVVSPGWMLHSLHGHDSALEKYEGIKWKNRIEGFFRHTSL